MPDPAAEMLAAVYERLEDDTTLDALAPGGVWSGNAPLSVTSYPYIAISYAAGSDATTYTATFMHAGSIMVRAVDRSGSQDAAIDALSRVYDLLHMQAIPVSGFDLQYLRRDGRGPFLSPLESGVQYQNCVDTYRMEVN